MIQFAWISHTGKIRERNEDNLCCRGEYLPFTHQDMDMAQTGSLREGEEGVFALFDGMGGESSGDAASFLAARHTAAAFADCSYQSGIKAEEKLRQEIREMNQIICQYTKEVRVSSMGSTAAFLWISGQGVTIANAGDSRIYRLHGEIFSQISEDHIFTMAMGNRKWLTQHLGIPEEEVQLSPHVCSYNYMEGDSYLLCSDGLTDLVSDSELAEQMKRGDSPKECVEDLCRMALTRGGHDNISIILCRISEGENHG